MCECTLIPEGLIEPLKFLIIAISVAIIWWGLSKL